MAVLRKNKKVSITALTPRRVSDLLGLADDILFTAANKVSVQMCALPSGAGGIGYIMAGIPVGTTPVVSDDTQVTAELSAAGIGFPGGMYQDEILDYSGGGIDLRTIWVDVSATCAVRVSAELKV